ncbi:choline-sulfatase [Microbacterium sp. SLBN-154]|uniref:sulfatase-like hydrolase/transferase n=1 Tax=Microbacterium sp. SLBN-154 TaxID=2768458 RepID=UPI0011528C93|nr:sulfatase-like hydrolase/transferase [Microbacterium sp. SLBN-154]TQK17697.1 choline-sulfatase [Microbacterium sp. SLBN-154]
MIEPTSPNVVLIFMDDMAHWALLSDIVHTPNLDRLRRRGVTFTHAFNQGSMEEAVCMPARQMLISGLTLFRAIDGFMNVPRIGRVLSDAGYDTYFTGKWHNEETALYTDYKEVGPWAGGMLHSTEIGGAAYLRPDPENSWDPADTALGGHWMTLDDGTIQHSSERWTDAAVSFITRGHDGAPYFLHLAYHAPHDPRQAPREFLDRYCPADLPLPPNFLPAHPFDNGELMVRDEQLAPLPRTPDSVRFHRREYFAILTHVDEQIGRLLDAVDAVDGQAGTVLVFSGDHGLALGEHGLFGKQNPYEHSIRVPLVIAAPEVKGGLECDELVYSGSIYPTVCELVGVSRPDHIEFRSLAPLMLGEADGEETIFNAYRQLQRVVRSGHFKLIEYQDKSHNQLFDLEADAWEMTNLYSHPGYTSVRDALAARLRERQIELGDSLLETRSRVDYPVGNS